MEGPPQPGQPHKPGAGLRPPAPGPGPYNYPPAGATPDDCLVTEPGPALGLGTVYWIAAAARAKHVPSPATLEEGSLAPGVNTTVTTLCRSANSGQLGPFPDAAGAAVLCCAATHARAADHLGCAATRARLQEAGRAAQRCWSTLLSAAAVPHVLLAMLCTAEGLKGRNAQSSPSSIATYKAAMLSSGYLQDPQLLACRGRNQDRAVGWPLRRAGSQVRPRAALRCPEASAALHLQVQPVRCLFPQLTCLGLLAANVVP